jgi:hypothetical protein
MRAGVITEADTCREFVTPRVFEAGWAVAPHAIGEQRSFTNGRIIVAGGKLRRDQQAHEQAAKAAQQEGDALYWPIYNLDLKNPNGKTGMEHADLKDPTASMRSHQAEVMRLLGELEALVAELQA